MVTTLIKFTVAFIDYHMYQQIGSIHTLNISNVYFEHMHMFRHIYSVYYTCALVSHLL